MATLHPRGCVMKVSKTLFIIIAHDSKDNEGKKHEANIIR